MRRVLSQAGGCASSWLILVFICFVCPKALTQVTWDGGAATSNWNDANNWNPDGLPGSNDDVSLSGATSIVDILSGASVTVKSLTISNEASLTIDNFCVLQINGSTSTYALSLNSGYINVFGSLQITNCQTGIGLLGNASSVTNTGSIAVDNHTGYGLAIVSGCVDCNMVTSSDLSFDNGSTLPAIFFGAGVGSGNIIINSGTLDIGATSHSGVGIGLGAVGGYFLNSGTINIHHSGGVGLNSGFIAGTFVNSSTGIVNFGAGLGGNWVGGFNLNLQNDGQININKAGTPVNVVVSGTGGFGGTETFATTNKVAPGDGSSAGCLLFNSGYSNSGTTSIKLGGVNQCSEHDVLFGSTLMDISGTLNVTLLNGFVPSPGQSFTLINAAVRTGFFTTINYPAVPGITWTTSYTSNSVIANAQSSLPVELVDFTAKSMDENGVLLEWRTDAEVNNSGFEILKSLDGDQWTKIGFEQGYGNSNETKYYRFTDVSPQKANVIYYRLRQIDLNGQSELSKVEVVHLSDYQPIAQLVPFPNPTNGIFKLHGDFPEDVLLTVYDQMGGIAKQCIASHSAQFDLSNLVNGVYTLIISYQNNVKTCRLVKQD